MKRYLNWALLTLAGLLFIGACQSTFTPAAMPPDTAAPTSTSLPPTQSPATPTPISLAPTQPPPTPSPLGPTEGKGNADVIYVRAVQTSDGTWAFHVTAQHPDTGWEDYADGWDVLTPDGTVLKPDPDSPFTRLLLHPHVNEQPFTRSQNGIAVPPGVIRVRVRAHDLVDGYGGREVVVDLTVREGKDFEVEPSP